ncbi:MAG: hypothetical protein ABI887_03055 [Burkholderiales bacterium]
MVKAGLYLITGGGGNSLLRFSATGLVLVNGKSADSYRALMSQIRKINKLSDMPLRAVILTNALDPQAANTARFAAANVPIVVQANAATHLAGSGAALIPFDRDYTMKLGGVEVQIKYFGRANTDADAVVYFPDKKVLAVGDLYSPLAPRMDAAAGGSLAGWSATLAQVLTFDFEQAVPNEGPIVGRDEVIAFKRQLDALIEPTPPMRRT